MVAHNSLSLKLMISLVLFLFNVVHTTKGETLEQSGVIIPIRSKYPWGKRHASKAHMEYVGNSVYFFATPCPPSASWLLSNAVTYMHSRFKVARKNYRFLIFNQN